MAPLARRASSFRRHSHPGTLVAVPATAIISSGCARLTRSRTGNTRPRFERCSAHRVGPQRSHRPRSRPVRSLPLRQLASDPSVPVEGGSANDYDYAECDPVNASDLDGNNVDTRTVNCKRGQSVVLTILSFPGGITPTARVKDRKGRTRINKLPSFRCTGGVCSDVMFLYPRVRAEGLPDPAHKYQFHWGRTDTLSSLCQ